MDQFINITPKELELIVQVVSSAAGCITVFIAYASIRQVKKLNKSKDVTEQKYKTIEIVTDPTSGLAYLSRKPKLNKKAHYQFLNWSLSEFENKLYLSDLGCSKKTIESLFSRMQTRSPLNRQNDHGAEYIRAFNHALTFIPFNFDTEVHKSNANLFNRLEDISSAINSDLLDVELLNFMYGGMINTIYKEHSEWVAWVKRRLGLRIYDQTDTLIDKLLEQSSERYSLFKTKFLFKLFFLGASGRSLLFDIITRKSVYSKSRYLTKNAFCNELTKRGLSKSTEILLSYALVSGARIKTLSAEKVKSSKFKTRKVKKLFANCWKDSKGVWPVGIQDWNTNQQLSKQNIDSWFSHVSAYWQVVFIAQLDIWNKHDYAGMIAITHGDTLLKNKERWNLEILGAIGSSLAGSNLNTKEFVEEIGIPTIHDRGIMKIDLQKMAIIQSFYTHKDIRESYYFEKIGRKLFRECIHYTRNQLGLIPFLTVLADSEFTQKAVDLYVTEGGAYLGTVRDAGRADQHLMHVFVF